MGCCGSKEQGTRDERAPLLAGAAPQPAAATAKATASGVEAGKMQETAAAAVQAGKLTGQALLQVAQNVPILAPVAYLATAVASSASEAIVLKADANEFQLLIEQLERILLK